ncbi:hypothetical protein Gogos_004156 [Gossypium gossypioides]|uniref:Uncharacterized protein n=1 Tax=Gossypium gossypioides TaxID=34282 RepID=A0A7J9CFS7_GOSGO|nr:hypothetical protein [Gossypium gossypioides]
MLSKWSSLCQATTGDHCEEDLINNVLVRLKQSLSIALVHFYPLAGRFATKIEQNPRSHFVDCNNSPGAEVIHAAVDISVPDIVSPTYVLLVVQSFFDHEGAINYDGHTRPLLSIQVTELVNGVFIEGDNGPLLTLPFTHQDEFITRVEAPHVLEKIFHFSAESIAKLKETANTKSNTTKISSFQFLTALLSRDWSHHCPHITLGTQLKLTAVTTAGELLEHGLGWAAWKLNQAVANHRDKSIRGFVNDWLHSPFIHQISQLFDPQTVVIQAHKIQYIWK